MVWHTRFAWFGVTLLLPAWLRPLGLVWYGFYMANVWCRTQFPKRLVHSWVLLLVSARPSPLQLRVPVSSVNV